MFSGRLVWALLVGAVAVTGVLLLDGRQPASRNSGSRHTESPADGVYVSSPADEHDSDVLREIRDSQKEILSTLRVIGQALVEQHGSSSSPNHSSPDSANDDEGRWVVRVRDAEQRMVADEVARLRANLLTEAKVLAAAAKNLKQDDPQLQVTGQQLRDVDEALRQLTGVRTVEDLVRLKFDFSSVTR
jgi:hypothetical protein